MRYILIIMLVFGLAGCMGHNTDDPDEAYRLWAGQEPPSEYVHVIHGKYWQSVHFTKEYVLYLELVVSPMWRDEYIKQNGLIQTDAPWTPPADAPDWFKPPKGYIVWSLPEPEQGSRVFVDAASGQMFIFEIQL